MLDLSEFKKKNLNNDDPSLSITEAGVTCNKYCLSKLGYPEKVSLYLDENTHRLVIKKDENGLLYTTGEQRTGCSMCGFGIQMEKRPHRFDRLRERNPKEWDFWMNRCCEDENGEKYGWGRVLDYIGVSWRDIPVEFEQLKMQQD